MTIQQFKRYDFEKQYQLLQEKGTFLMTRSTDDAWIVLFNLHNFYVEVVQEKLNGELYFIRCFDNLELLEPYLKQINIAPILND